jgi:serine/threonine protein kinase
MAYWKDNWQRQLRFYLLLSFGFSSRLTALLGRVKIARHARTGQYAAIKIVSKHALVNSRLSVADAADTAEKILLGIEREIVIMKLIDHPNVLKLYDVWETTGELYVNAPILGRNVV